MGRQQQSATFAKKEHNLDGSSTDKVFYRVKSTEFTNEWIPHLVGRIGMVVVPQPLTLSNEWYTLAFKLNKASSENYTFKLHEALLEPAKVSVINSDNTLNIPGLAEALEKSKDFDDLIIFPGAFVHIITQSTSSSRGIIISYIGNKKCSALLLPSSKVQEISIQKLSPVSLDHLAVKNVLNFWVGKRVRVMTSNNDTKYCGSDGIVTRGIRNWNQVCFDNTNESCMIRTSDLVLTLQDSTSTSSTSTSSTTVLKPHPSSSTSHHSKKHRWSERSEAKKTRNSSILRSSSIMWIDRMVVLPDKVSTGTVKSVDHGLLLIELTGSKKLVNYRKEDLYLCKEGRVTDLSVFNDALDADSSSFIPLPVHGDGFPEQAKRHVAKLMDVFKRRPNIKQWTIKIDAEGKSPEHPPVFENDMSELVDVQDLMVVSECVSCGTEKERSSDACWNEACEISVVAATNNSTTTSDKKTWLTGAAIQSGFGNFKIQAPTSVLARYRKRRFVSTSVTSPWEVSEDNKRIDGSSYRWMRRVNTTTEKNPEGWKNLDDLTKRVKVEEMIETTIPVVVEVPPPPSAAAAPLVPPQQQTIRPVNNSSSSSSTLSQLPRLGKHPSEQPVTSILSGSTKLSSNTASWNKNQSHYSNSTTNAAAAAAHRPFNSATYKEGTPSSSSSSLTGSYNNTSNYQQQQQHAVMTTTTVNEMQHNRGAASNNNNNNAY